MGYIIGGLKELISFATVIVTFPLGVVNWDLKTKKSRSPEILERPILLVHGYLHNGSAWLYQRKALQKAGFGSIFTLNLGSPHCSVEDYSEKVRVKVMQIERETGRSDLILMGHSMGGIVSSYYATQIAPLGSVTHLITLGSPLEGTRLSPIGVGQSALQMRYKSSFISWIRDELVQHPEIQCLHLASKNDLFIWPQDSAALIHDNATVKMYSYRGHMSYLYSFEVMQDILEFLRIKTPNPH